MILLDEAVERFNRAGRPYGARVQRRMFRGRARSAFAQIDAEIAPLRVPDELRAFWSAWDPGTIKRPALDGFIPLVDIVERREMDIPPAPAILLPIADWTHARIWMELSSSDHPGGRVFHSYHDETQVRLWAFGISGLLDLLSEAFERDLIDDRRGGLHGRHMDALIEEMLDEQVGRDVPRLFEAVDRSKFPAHWLDAEGLPPDHFELRGATHTVRSFRLERETSARLSATLVGTYQTSVGGGPLEGCVGTFEDETGMLQVFVPQLTGLVGSVGHGGAVEVDILAVSPNGEDLSSLSAKSDLQNEVQHNRFDYQNDLIIRLFEQMKYLDTSVVVTGLRPIR
ncbi:MAG: hypothetical protein ACR2NL_02665 [Acidimicrobiia bacterium]